jgi:hypothetical protein
VLAVLAVALALALARSLRNCEGRAERHILLTVNAAGVWLVRRLL